MASYFFRVDHDLLRSDSFKSLGGSAIKVYLVLGLYSDFGTGWAFPSIRTIARQAGLSRQTVLTALGELAQAGLVVTQKATGKSNAYRIIRQAPERPQGPQRGESISRTSPVPKTLDVASRASQKFLAVPQGTRPNSLEDKVQNLGASGRKATPKRQPTDEKDQQHTSVPIPDTPFRLTADGRLLVAVDLRQLLTGEGLPKRTAERLLAQKDPEAVAKVLLNAFYLRSQGKLQNGPGYIRAGIEAGYELLPQVANRLESRRKQLEAELNTNALRHERLREESALAEEEEAIRMVLERLSPSDLQSLILQAVESLPGPLVRHNPTLSNPFVRTKVYELAGGEPVE